jgi:hypothetical protein
LICPYFGEIIDEQELFRRYADKTAYGVQIKAHQIYEDGALKRGIGTLINHYPANKNCRFSIARNNTINIIAIKNIRNRQELYGPLHEVPLLLHVLLQELFHLQLEFLRWELLYPLMRLHKC